MASLDQAYLSSETRAFACELVELATAKATVRQQVLALIALREMRVKMVNLGTGRRYSRDERRLAVRMLSYKLKTGAANDGA